MTLVQIDVAGSTPGHYLSQWLPRSLTYLCVTMVRPVSIADETSYVKISEVLKPEICVIAYFDRSEIWRVSRQHSVLRDFARSYDMKFYMILKRVPGLNELMFHWISKIKPYRINLCGNNRAYQPGVHYRDYNPGSLSLYQVTTTHLKIGHPWTKCLGDLTTWQEYRDSSSNNDYRATYPIGSFYLVYVYVLCNISKQPCWQPFR